MAGGLETRCLGRSGDEKGTSGDMEKNVGGGCR